MTNRYVVFLPPGDGPVPPQWAVGIKFCKADTTAATLLWKTKGELTKKWDQDSTSYQYVFIPVAEGSEVAGDYFLAQIAEQIARDLNGDLHIRFTHNYRNWREG